MQHAAAGLAAWCLVVVMGLCVATATVQGEGPPPQECLSTSPQQLFQTWDAVTTALADASTSGTDTPVEWGTVTVDGANRACSTWFQDWRVDGVGSPGIGITTGACGAPHRPPRGQLRAKCVWVFWGRKRRRAGAAIAALRGPGRAPTRVAAAAAPSSVPACAWCRCREHGVA